MAVIKVLELVGESKTSWEEAAQEAVRQAAKTIRNIRGVEILNMTGNMNEKGEIVEFKTNVKIAFRVEDE